jgi:hypothetical protein
MSCKRTPEKQVSLDSGMPRLFTYTIPIDDGCAPNPFRGMCSLAICKPGIRRVAREYDWVAGLGSKAAPSGDLSQHLVYAMKMERVLSLKAYDEYAAEKWPHRVPDTKRRLLSHIPPHVWNTPECQWRKSQSWLHQDETVLIVL